MREFLLLAHLPLLLASAALAQPQGPPPQVELSFPLGEHYRPGRFLPVRVVARHVGAGSPITIEAAGAVPTEVAPTSGAADAVVPLLAVTTLKDVRWSVAGAAAAAPPAPEAPPAPAEPPAVGAASAALRPLAADERLVGTTADDGDARGDAFAAQLFPGKKILTLPLDLADPFPGPALAWGTLDAVLLEPAAAARVNEAQLATLLAGGAAVAVRAEGKPGGEWPWQRREPWWVAAPQLAGPDDLIEPAAYEPAAAWNPGWPASFRRTIVLALVAFSILAVALTLWRSRHATPAIVGLSLVALGGLAAWRAGATSTRAALGVVRVDGPGWSQLDAWTYHRGLAGRMHLAYAFDVTRPVFASRRHFERAALTLEAGDGRSPPRFRYTLEADRTIAFLNRRLDVPRPTGVTSGELPSPLRGMARGLYLRRGGRIAGSVPGSLPHAPPDDYELWPLVVVEVNDEENDEPR